MRKGTLAVSNIPVSGLLTLDPVESPPWPQARAARPPIHKTFSQETAKKSESVVYFLCLSHLAEIYT